MFESAVFSDRIVEGFIFIFKDPASIVVMCSIFFMQGILWFFANSNAFKWFTLALAVQIFIFVTANVATKGNLFYLNYLYELTALLPWSIITMLFEPISQRRNEKKIAQLISDLSENEQNIIRMRSWIKYKNDRIEKLQHHLKEFEMQAHVDNTPVDDAARRDIIDKLSIEQEEKLTMQKKIEDVIEQNKQLLSENSSSTKEANLLYELQEGKLLQLAKDNADLKKEIKNMSKFSSEDVVDEKLKLLKNLKWTNEARDDLIYLQRADHKKCNNVIIKIIDYDRNPDDTSSGSNISKYRLSKNSYEIRCSYNTRFFVARTQPYFTIIKIDSSHDHKKIESWFKKHNQY